MSSRKKDDRPVPGDRITPRKAAKPQFASTVLQLEAFVVAFAALAMFGLRDSVFEKGLLVLDSTAAMWTLTGVLFVVLMVLSRMVTRPGGYVAGTVVQVPVLALGLLLPMMYLVGGIFVVMWFVALRLGERVDTERAAYDAEHPETAPNT
ncbi:uncharacterized protein DUF4233 [Isoptericola jiangsuensis]|uniref:Uncharacterized protein DUF4233 n=1 Tax=Isoptericola jiangsuensis TaxID=548579 RepID=A0A2A9EV27_9MICO|nr:DUF4233 domain-containing protein [Isoptericola jiangsuensis]PFG42738.1 uncharacterized protein DUF4233 [Isoptericola jiangsuensis]